MSAFDLLSFNAVADASARTTATVSPTETNGSEPGARSFRDELSDADASRRSTSRAETQATRGELASERRGEASESTAETSDASAEQASVSASEEASADATANEPTADLAADDAAAADELAAELTALDEAAQELAPVAELVLDLIAAFENVLQDSPLVQPTTAAGGETAPAEGAFPGLTALFEALSAVSALTGANANEGLTVAPTTPPVVAPPASSPLGASGLTVAGETPSLTGSSENAGAQAQTSDESADGQGQSGNNQAANAAAVKLGESGAVAAGTNAAATAPGFDAAASNTAAQPVTPLVNNSPAGTDVSAKLTPSTLADPNSTNDALNTARLTRGLSNAVNQQGGTVTLRLTPPDLGTVRIQLNLQGTNVSADFHAETANGQRLLSQQLGQLRASLESQGLNVDKLNVQAMSPSSNSSGLQQQSSNDPSQSQSQAGGDGRSRGQYNGQSSSQNGQQNPGGDSRSFTQLFETEPEPALVGDAA